MSWRANHSCESKVFVYQTIQSEKAKKVLIQKSCSRWHRWFYVWLFRLWWEKLCRARWWEIWSFTEMCASCYKAMQWSSWSQKFKKFFDNWFTKFGTIWLNRLRGCPPDSTKVPVKNGAMDRVVIISHQTWLELSLLGSWKDGVERRRWETTFHVLKLFIQQCNKSMGVATWRTYCYHCIEYRARQSACISLIPQRSMPGSYTVVTFVRMENQIRIQML